MGNADIVDYPCVLLTALPSDFEEEVSCFLLGLSRLGILAFAEGLLCLLADLGELRQLSFIQLSSCC